MIRSRFCLLILVVGLLGMLVTFARVNRSSRDTVWERNLSQDHFGKAQWPPNSAVNTAPPGAVAHLQANKKQFFFGEEIMLTFEIRNIGKRPFSIFRGGDYRGATRHLGFHVTATHADGTEMPDPHPDQSHFGGLGRHPTIEPGKSHADMLPLLAYRRLTKPGLYRVTVTREWKLVSATTIEVRDPTPAEARWLLDDMDKYLAERRKEHPTTIMPAYGRLTHPVYLPLLRERALAGSDSVLLALGQMPDPEATKTIIELLDHKDPNFVAFAEEALYLRLPDPELAGQVDRRGAFEQDDSVPRKFLRDASWRPEFAAAVRAHACRTLAKADEKNQERAAFMLCCVGTPEDWPTLHKALDAALIVAQGLPFAADRYPRPPRVCAELRRAVQMLVVRGVEVSITPASGAERILFVEAINRHPDFRPKGWEETYANVLRDPLDYVRLVAIEALPAPLPDFARKLLPDLLADAHVDVQIAACHVVDKVKAPEWKTAVVKTLTEAQEDWLINAAGNAAHELCTPLERLEIYVNKLTDPKAAKASLGRLTMIFNDSSGASIHEHLWTPEQRQDCQAAWRQFIGTHREQLTKPRPFSVLDPIPIKELFPGHQFDPPRKGNAPRLTGYRSE